MDQNNPEERVRPKILPINLEECRRIADKISDQLSDLEEERVNDLSH
jgi:hypothetical protein